MKKFGSPFLLFTLLVLEYLLQGCANPATKLPNYGKVPAFTMTDSEGHPFTENQFTGMVSIVDFIYTNCPAECPLMSSKMHRIAEQLKGERDVQFVSISVDPLRDTPPVLDAFAHRYGGPTAQWKFLTGSPQTVHLIAYETFHVGDVLGKIEHSTKFIVVDKRGDLRGYYSTFGADDIPAMLKDVAALRHQKVS